MIIYKICAMLFFYKQLHICIIKIIYFWMFLLFMIDVLILCNFIKPGQSYLSSKMDDKERK